MKSVNEVFGNGKVAADVHAQSFFGADINGITNL
jgi:hypothetical protein